MWIDGFLLLKGKKLSALRERNKPCSFLIMFQMTNMLIIEREKCFYIPTAISTQRDEAKICRRLLNGAWSQKKKKSITFKTSFWKHAEIGKNMKLRFLLSCDYSIKRIFWGHAILWSTLESKVYESGRVIVRKETNWLQVRKPWGSSGQNTHINSSALFML